MKVKTDKIIDVIFKYPELVVSDAKEQYITLVEIKKKLEDAIWESRQEIHKMEANLKVVEDQLNVLGANIQEVIYEQKEVVEIKGVCNLGIRNSSDARNASYGN